MTIHKLIFLFGLLVISGCERETVDPNDYTDDNSIRPNQFTLKSETYLLTADDKTLINGINEEGLLVDKSASWLDDIKVGSVVVNTASDPGDTMAYFRKVTEIIEFPNNIGIRTVDVNLHEAFSRYIIDSRSNEAIITRSFPYTASASCTPTSLKDWIGLSFGVEPHMDADITFDVDSTYFTAQYDSAGTIPFRVDMQIRNLEIALSGTVKFKGNFEAGPAINIGPAIVVFPIASTGLSLYAQAKAKFRLSAKGEINSPQLAFISGPHNFSFTYDESRAEPLTYDINPVIKLDILSSEDWSATASGKAEIQVGAEIFIAVTGLPKFAKTGFNLFGYATATAEQKGNFTDLQPRVAFNAAIGIGAKAFAELSFLGSNVPNSKTGWINLSGKLESPDFKTDVIQWIIANHNTCLMYNSVEMFTENFQTSNEIFLTVDCPDCTATGFLAWVNDMPIDNGNSFDYNQSAVITLPPGLELSNTIAIQDIGKPGCYLQDNFLDPELFNSNCTKFTDSRDGNSYCMIQLGSQTWMGENLRYSGGNSIGHWYHDLPAPDTLLFGRLYSFSEVLGGEGPNEQGGAGNQIRGICPQGWHLPSQAEWRTLRDFAGGISIAGKNLKIPSDGVWPGTSLPVNGTFNATSAGEYYPWHEGHGKSVSGNQYKKTTFWTSERIQFNNETSKPIVVIIDDSNALNIGAAAVSQSGGFLGVSSIENIGYSCRCVKN